MDASSKSDASEGERSGRRYRTLDEKLQILAEATRPGASMDAVFYRLLTAIVFYAH
jgi:hypothetical protein